MSFSAGLYKWGDPVVGTPSGTITWDTDMGAGLAYDTAVYNQADFDNALAAAFQSWEDVSGLDFEAATGSGADIAIGLESMPGSTIGYASLVYNVLAGIDQITSAAVYFDSDEYWSPYGDGGLNFYAVALHEIGHAIGLEHVDDTSEIMNPYLSAVTLGDGDIAGAQYLYGTGGAEAVSDPDAPVLLASASGGDGGGGGGGALGILGVIVAALAALLGFGSIGAAAAAAAMTLGDDEDQPDHGETGDGFTLDDMMAALDTGEVYDDSVPDDWYDDEMAAV